MKEVMFNEKVWVDSENKFNFKEGVDESGNKKFILEGLMLPFNKISRNNVKYNKESVIKAHKQLIGKPVMYNHKVEGTELPVGHYIDSSINDDGWVYKADIDPEETELIRKLERGDLRHVSIQLVGGKVEERVNEDTGSKYSEAWIKDVIEGSIVPAPGFLDTSAKFAEALKHSESEKEPGVPKKDGTGPRGDTPECPENDKDKEEDINTDNAKGVMKKKLLKKDEMLSVIPKYMCPDCGARFHSQDKPKFCPMCGYKGKFLKVDGPSIDIIKEIFKRLSKKELVSIKKSVEKID